MTISFSVEQFYGVFTAYDTAAWPMQLPLLALGVLAYHLAFFTAINPLAYGFAAVFLAGAMAFFWYGVVRRRFNFKLTSGWRMWAGWSLIIFAWFIYPAWTSLAGHRCSAFPTFGPPCPTTLFPIGLLAFLVKPYPRNCWPTLARCALCG